MVLALSGAVSGCSRVVPGTASAEPIRVPSAPAPSGPTASSPAPSGPAPSSPATAGPVPSSAAPSGPAPSGPGAPSGSAAPDPTPSGKPRSGLVVDSVENECLLDASEFGALVGMAVRPPEEGTVRHGDGSTGSSCVAVAGSDPVAMINIYKVRSGTPADYVLAGTGPGRHTLTGVGEAAQVIDTDVGPTLQLAGPTYLVTILVSGDMPSDDAWRTAAEAALAHLPP